MIDWQYWNTLTSRTWLGVQYGCSVPKLDPWCLQYRCYPVQLMLNTFFVGMLLNASVCFCFCWWWWCCVPHTRFDMCTHAITRNVEWPMWCFSSFPQTLCTQSKSSECGYEERAKDEWQQTKEYYRAAAAQCVCDGVSNWRKLNKSLNVWRSL